MPDFATQKYAISLNERSFEPWNNGFRGILLVEDDAALSAALTEALAQAAMPLMIATDRETARDPAKNDVYDPFDARHRLAEDCELLREGQIALEEAGSKGSA
jgi:hypothetical protein